MSDPAPDYRNSFNTNLSPAEEVAFQAWTAAESARRKRDVTRDLENYDLRGYWKGVGRGDNASQGHMTDTFKKPNHPTFSDESQYHGAPAPWGKYLGGKWDESGYTPSPEMLAHTHDLKDMEQYFKEAEPDMKLRAPAQAAAESDWTPPSARALDETDNWAPPSARPLQTFTGKAERAAEEKKLAESMNPLQRLLVGTGGGALETKLKIDDLLSNLPGNAGAKPNWDTWGQEADLYNRHLGQDTLAGVGNLTGQTAMLAPAGGAAGAVMRAALGAVLPPALSAAAPLLTLGAEGASQGLLAADPEHRAEGALTGLKFGLGAGGVGQLLSKLASLAGGGQEAIRVQELAKARAAQAQAEKEAAGAVGSATQKGSRLEENFATYLNDPNLPPEIRAALAQWKAGPRSQELLSDVLTNQLEAAPAVSGEIAGKQAALRALQDGSEEAIQAAANRAVSGGTAWRQVKERALRYGLPALTGYLGHHFLGGMGGMMGLAGGSVLRPMFHSMKHLVKSPAFQTALLRGGETFAGGLGSLADIAGMSQAPFVSSAMPNAPQMTMPAFANSSDGGQSLAQLALANPFARRQAEAP